MRFLRWITIAILLLTSSWAQATIHSSPMLNEASGLVEVSPLQAKKMAQQYLNERHLAEKLEKTPPQLPEMRLTAGHARPAIRSMH